MFDAGFLEFLVIAVVALLVVGPERLPGLARKAGRFIGKARSYINGVRTDIEREFHAEDLKRLLEQQQHEIRELRDQVNEAGQEIKSSVEESAYLVSAVNEDEQQTPEPLSADSGTAKTISHSPDEPKQ